MESRGGYNTGGPVSLSGLAEKVLMKLLLILPRYLWAFPATMLGLFFVPLAGLSGGSIRLVQGALEIQGGLVTLFLRKGLLVLGPAAAMTLGHVILGCDQGCLDHSRAHEHVHVRQYERWGPLMLPLYLVFSAIQYLRGLDPYLDNPFEREAFRRAG
jgi:hypothetical protein